jgi:membrane protein
MLLVAGIGLVMLASLVSSAVLGAVAQHAPRSALTPALLRAAELAMSFVLLTTVFVATFHLLPRTRPPVGDVAFGALLTTVGLTMLKSVFALYLANLTSYSAFGIVGGVLALATWIYVSSLIILFGATLTRVRCEQKGCLAAMRSSPPRPVAEEQATAPGAARASRAGAPA